VAVGRGRQAAQGKGADRIERAEDAFHQRVAEAFRAARDPNVVHVDADRAPDALHAAIWEVVAARLPGLAAREVRR
jgi:thymidylate kinase